MSTSPPASPERLHSLERSRLAQRLRRVLRGQALFDEATRWRYCSDASSVRVLPQGVVIPADETDVVATLALARELDVAVALRGAGSSRAGQALGAGLVVDLSQHLNRIIAFDPAAGLIEVQPGLQLDRLNATLAAHGLWLPVDAPNAAQATIGGMAANDAAGPSALTHGAMLASVQGIDILLADGSQEHFGPFGARTVRRPLSAHAGQLVSRLFELAGREREEIERRWPRVPGPVGGYNLDAFCPLPERPYTSDGSVNLAHLLVGSQGTLGCFRRLHLRLAPLPAHRVLGAWRLFAGSARAAAVRAVMALNPTAVEVFDRALLEPLRADPSWCAGLDGLLEAGVQAVLVAQFAGQERGPLLRSLHAMSALAAGDERPDSRWLATDAALHAMLAALRVAALRGLPSPRALPGAPLADEFVVPLARLDDWFEALEQAFLRQGMRAAWYGCACRGALRLRLAGVTGVVDAIKLRQLAAEAGALARSFGGASPDAVHGAPAGVPSAFDGRLEQAFATIKSLFDPDGLFNPGRIVPARSVDPLALLPTRATIGMAGHPPAPIPARTTLDWSSQGTPARSLAVSPTADPAADEGFLQAVSACDGNAACRTLEAGAMCPSYRVTMAERESTRGRANTLRLALEGRFGSQGLAAPEVADALKLCVGCKACRSECPAGVDMARMKIEVLRQQQAQQPMRWRERAFARFPDWAPTAARLAWLFNLRDRLPGLPALGERLFGLSRRPLPRWRRDTFLRAVARQPAVPADACDVVLFADCLNNHFDPANLHAASRVLGAAGLRVAVARPAPGDPQPLRPLCCGRTLLAAGQVDAARAQARRTLAALAPFIDRGIAVVGLEPECILSMRDEYRALGLGEAARRLADQALLLGEYLAREHATGRPGPRFAPPRWKQVLLHGHCHQQAFDAVRPSREVLARLDGLEIRQVAPGCCGMVGGFGYDTATEAIAQRMAGLALLPAVRAASADTVIIADGFGCRRQVADSTGREAWTLARVLEACLADAPPPTRSPGPADLAARAPRRIIGVRSIRTILE